MKLDALVDECRAKAEMILELDADLQQKEQDIKNVLDDGRNLRQEISEKSATISKKDNELSSLRQANFRKVCPATISEKDNELPQSINQSKNLFHTLIIKYNIFKKNYVGKGKVEV